MLSEDFEQAQYLSSQVEQARQRAVLAASDSGAARDDARSAEQLAREYAKKAGLVVVDVDQAVLDARAAADRAEAPTDSMVATLATNPVSLTRAAVDSATGDMITTEGSTTQAAGDARWVTKAGADILVASEIERTGSETQVSGDNRWVTNEGADNTVSALFSAPDSAVQAAADNRYSKRGENYIYVPDYAPTDGSDATAGIQAAANLAAGFGHILDFGTSEHQYWVAGVVELGGRTVLTGKGAVLYKRDSALESSYAIFCTRSHGVAAYGAGGSSIRFNNLRFKGNFPNRPACALSAHHSDDIQFHGCDFEEMAGTGHVIDLGACRDTLFRDCRFIGATAVNSRAECIQADLSIRSGVSVLDDAGSYSGLPTIRVTVDNCKFLPLSKDGVDYPAPVPFGSHAQWEGRWFEDMKFINNTVVNGRVHTGTDPVGLIHFSCVKGLTVRGNTFVNMLTSTGRVISVTKAADGALTGADPNATSNPTGTFAQIMRSSKIDIGNNVFTGFFSTVYKVIYVDGCSDLSTTVNKWDGCGSMYDIRDTVGWTSYGNTFRNPSATIAAQVVNINKVTKAAASNEVIDVTGVASITDIVFISNNSSGGLFANSVIIGKGTDGIRQAAGSTLATTGNVLI